MSAVVVAAILGLAVAVGIVQLAAIRRGAFSFQCGAASGVIAIFLVLLVATIAAYFLTRVCVRDRYEANSVIMVTFVIGPAAIGALLGTITGGFLAYHTLHSRS